MYSLRVAQGLVLALALALGGANPGWPSSDPQLSPAELAQPEWMPDDPEYAPVRGGSSGCEGQLGLYSFTPACTPAIDATEQARGLGSGIHADRAWLWTTGRGDVRVAVLGEGVSWSDPDLAPKVALSPGELPAPDTAASPGLTHDANGDGAFDARDYTSATGTTAPSIALVVDRALLARADRGDTNQNGLLDPGDLLTIYADGIDGDANGYVDDIAGWDYLDEDNDPGREVSDPIARVAAAITNNGAGGAGACPRCGVLPIRVSERGLAPGNALGLAIIYATDSGAKVAAVSAAAAGGSILITRAIAHANANGTLVVAGASRTGDTRREPAFDPELVLIAGTITHSDARRDRATSALAPDPCSGSGLALSLVAPGRCDDTAVGLTAGAAGLAASAALGIPERNVAPLSPPLSAGELRRLLAGTAAVLPNRSSWSPMVGWGRADARAAVDAVIQRRIAPGIRLVSPEPQLLIDPTSGAAFLVTARVENRRASAGRWVLERALGDAPEDSAFLPIASGTVGPAELAEVEAHVETSGLSADPTQPPAGPGAFAVTLRLSASAGSGADATRAEVRRVVHVHRDLELLPGFPRALGAGVLGSPRLADLDGDGDREIVIATDAGRIYAIDAAGRDLPGWPRGMPAWRLLEPGAPGGHAGAPAFRTGAVARDVEESILSAPSIAPPREGERGRAVIVLGSEGTLAVLEPDGRTRTARVPVGDPADPAGAFAPPVIFEVDGAVTIHAAAGGDLHTLDRELELRGSVTIDPPARTGPLTAGDLDGDGALERVVATDHRLLVLDASGRVRSEVELGAPSAAPWGLDGLLVPAPAIADVLDRRDGLDVVLAPRGRPLLVLSGGVEPTLTARTNRGSFGARSSAPRAGAEVLASGAPVAIADLDGDGVLDVAAAIAPASALDGPAPGSGAEHLLGAWSAAGCQRGKETCGAFLPGLPVPSGGPTSGGPVIGDLDGDARPELVAAGAPGLLEAYSAEGQRPRRWPKLTGAEVAGSPVIGELDGGHTFEDPADGRSRPWGTPSLEVVAVTRTGHVLAWRTRGRAEEPSSWPGHRHDDGATGSALTPLPVLVEGSGGSGCGCSTQRVAGPGALGLLVAVAALARPVRRRRSR